MTHLSFRTDDVELEVDYVVVGSGAGGATAANALARGGARVALIEAGPWRDPDDYPSTTYGAMRDLFDDWGVGIARGRALWPIVQASCVGGTTVINCAICVSVCPPEAIFEDCDVPKHLTHFIAINREFFSAEVTGLGNPAGASSVGAALRDHPSVASTIRK